MINIQEKKACCGCNACVQRCPKQCIRMQEDSEGFLYPCVDKSICIDCGLCERVCPMLNLDEPQESLSVLAVKNRNGEERMKSSSGGVFIALAQSVLANGGVVFGAVFDENWEVRHTWADTLEGVYPMMGSKYLQSRIEESFKEAEGFLKQGREVLFTGSPCQIAGLRKYLRKEYGNLLAVDFICHGVPSPGVWRRYLNEVKTPSARRAAAGRNSVCDSSLNAVPEITGIAFRDKTLSGWKKFSFVVRSKSASKADRNTVLLSAIFLDNPYMKGFLADIYLRPSCYSCRHKCGKSYSDLTIADFWGIDRIMPEFDDDKGVGLVILNSVKGQSAFNALPDMECVESTIDVVCTYNPAYHRSPHIHPKRDAFYQQYAKGGSVSELAVNYARVPFRRLMKSRLVAMLKRLLPATVIKQIKKMRNK